MFRILKRKCLEWKQGTNIWPIIESDFATWSISILKYNSKRVINIFLSTISTSPYFWRGCNYVGEICWWQSMLLTKYVGWKISECWWNYHQYAFHEQQGALAAPHPTPKLEQPLKVIALDDNFHVLQHWL